MKSTCCLLASEINLVLILPRDIHTKKEKYFENKGWLKLKQTLFYSDEHYIVIVYYLSHGWLIVNFSVAPFLYSA